jgi:DNA-binding MarR family transcriptional regulator
LKIKEIILNVKTSRQQLIAELGAAFQAQQRAVDGLDEAVANYLGVNRTDLRCLDVLLAQGSATPGYLAAAVGLTTGSVTTMLDRLEGLGYLQRTPDPADRRRVEVRPTAEAINAAARLYGPLVQDGQRDLARYTMAELELFLDFLQRDRPRQEAHAERIRNLPRRVDDRASRRTRAARRSPG